MLSFPSANAKNFNSWPNTLDALGLARFRLTNFEATGDRDAGILVLGSTPEQTLFLLVEEFRCLSKPRGFETFQIIWVLPQKGSQEMLQLKKGLNPLWIHQHQ